MISNIIIGILLGTLIFNIIKLLVGKPYREASSEKYSYKKDSDYNNMLKNKLKKKELARN